MQARSKGLWGASDAYERYMGRWSRKVAAQFLDWLAVPQSARWIDIGCGTAVLAAAIVESHQPSSVVGIDTSATFLETARRELPDPRASFKQGDAQSLPLQDACADVVVSGLVLNFVPDKEAAIAEMVRVSSPGGIVALYVWDYAGHMQIMRRFFDAATALDQSAREFDDGVKAPVCRPTPLRSLFERAGLTDIAVKAIDIPAAFDSFEDYWTPFLGGTGSAPKYCASLSESARERLRIKVQNCLPIGPDGEILLAARAWGIKGKVPLLPA
jgi:trans-aconitate methyltransferase